MCATFPHHLCHQKPREALICKTCIFVVVLMERGGENRGIPSARELETACERCISHLLSSKKLCITQRKSLNLNLHRPLNIVVLHFRCPVWESWIYPVASLCYSQATFCLRKKHPERSGHPNKNLNSNFFILFLLYHAQGCHLPAPCGFCITQVQLVKPSIILLLGPSKVPGSSQTWPELEREAGDKGESRRRAVLSHPMQDKHHSSHVLNEVLFLWEKQHVVLLRRAVPYGKIDLIDSSIS